MTALCQQQRSTTIVLLCAMQAAAAFNLLQLSTTQRYGSYHSLNVHDIYGENVKKDKHLTARFGWV